MLSGRLYPISFNLPLAPFALIIMPDFCTNSLGAKSIPTSFSKLVNTLPSRILTHVKSVPDVI